MAVIGKVFAQFVKLIVLILKPILFFLLFIVGVTVLLSWLSAILGILFGLPYGRYFIGNHAWVSALMYFQVFIAISIPLLSIGFAIWSLLRNVRPGVVRLKKRLWGLWIVNLIILVSIASFFTRDIASGGSISNATTIETPSEIMEVNFQNYEANDALFMVSTGAFLLVNNEFINKNVSLEFIPSEGGIVINQSNYSRARTTKDAEYSAKNIDYKINHSPNKIDIPSYFKLPQGTQWRNQRVRLKIELPLGQKIKIPVGQSHDIKGFGVGDCQAEGKYYMLEMTEDGLTCVSE